MGIARSGGDPDRFYPYPPQGQNADTDTVYANADNDAYASGNDADTDAADHADAYRDASADHANADSAAARTRTGYDPAIWNRPGINRARRPPKIWQEGRERG